MTNVKNQLLIPEEGASSTLLKDNFDPASTLKLDGYECFSSASELYKQGDLSKAKEILINALEIFDEFEDNSGILKSLLLFGRICRDLGDFDEAQELFIQALNLSKQTMSLEAEVDALNLQASIFSINGKDDVALEYLEQAHQLASKHSSQEKIASILTNIGRLNFKLGDYSIALSNTKEAHSLFERFSPNSSSAAANLLNIGNIYRDISEYSTAKYYYKKAQILGIRIQNFTIKAAALNNLGLVHIKLKELNEALSLFNEALSLSIEKEYKQYQIDNLDGIGQVYVLRGEYKKAVNAHVQALKVAKEIGDFEGEADSLLSLGKDYIALSKPDQAIKYLQLAIEHAIELEHRKTIYEIHQLLSIAYEQTGNITKALYHHKAYHNAEKEVFNEKSEETTRQLTVKFDLERARFEAEEYRLSSEVAERATLEAEKIVQIRTRELEGAQLEVVMRLAQAAELRDEDTGEHTFRVGRNAAAIAYCLGWSEAEVKIIYLAARLHDVGKIGISDTILLNPGKLTDDEFELMRQHTVIGAKMLSNGQSALLRMAEKIALSHHERWDGNGYPNKLAGEAIPDVARIVSVADVLDALTHARPYKKAWSVEETLAEIERNSGRQFDPNIVRIAIKVFSGEKCLSPVAKPSDWEETFKELQDLFGLSRFSM